ncbi:hypothetical protein GCM10020229_49970 [Kitasatospora albolonga]|uniref:hypothetical protein n=1 Tax=Kitasatospora albolonga TaxID=68173 RepID=UPI0031EFD1DD
MTEKPNDPDRLESPTEQLLRAALAARAEQVTAQNLRPAAPPTRRTRKVRPFHVVTTIAMFGLAAGLAIGVLSTGGHPVAQDVAPAVTASASPSPSPTPTASPSAELTPSGSASASATETEEPPATTTVEFHKVKVEVPAGWTVDARDPTSLCLRVPGAAVAAKGECLPQGVMITAYDKGVEQLWPSEADLDSDSGWSHQPACYLPGDPGSTGVGDDYRRIGQPQRSLVTLNGKYVNKVRWQVACDATRQYTAQMWGFHKEQVFVNANGLPEKYQADLESIMAGLDVSGRAGMLRPGNGADVKVTLGQEVANPKDGDKQVVTVPVTFTNVSSTDYPSVEPVMMGTDDPASPASLLPGTLERKDGDRWTALPALWKGTGMDYAATGQAGAFPLAAGKSRTVTYRIKVSSSSDRAGLAMVAEAYLPTTAGQFRQIGATHDWVILVSS